jgi:hypothetical protein
MKRLLTASIGVLLAIGLLAGTRAYGQLRTWDGNGTPDNSGNWSTAANWSSDNIPDSNTETGALLNVTSGERTVTMDSSYTIKQLQMTQTTVGATNKLLLNGTLRLTNTTSGFPPLSLTPPAGGTNSLVLDLNGQTLVTSNYNYCVELNGTVNMGPGSLLDMELNSWNKYLTISNLGVLAQNSSTSRWYKADNGGNLTDSRNNFFNRGVWSLENNAAFLLVGSAVVGVLAGCENSGTLTVRNGSVLTFVNLTSTGYLEAGTNSVLGNINSSSTLTIGSGGTFVVNGTNAIVGAQTPPASSVATLVNAGTTFVGTNATPAELVMKGRSAGLSNAVGSVLSAVPGSRIVLRFTQTTGNARWDNLGTFTQDNVVVQIDLASAGGTGTRRLSNAGTWTLQNGAQVQYVSSTASSLTNTGYSNMVGNANSGTMSLLSGSSIAMHDLSNTGTLILGTNITLFTGQFSGANEPLDNRGSVSVVGTNALIGHTNAAGSSFVIFTNGSAGSQGALLTIGDGVNGAECIIQGRNAHLINFVGNTVTVARASTLRLTGTRGSADGFTSLDAYLMNSGVVVNAGTIQLQPSHAGAVNPDNYGTYSIGAGASATGEIQRLAVTVAGNNSYYQLAFNNRVGGTVTGQGVMLYTNKTGNTVADYMQFVNAGTIAPGAPVGTLELVNTAVTNAGGTIAIQLYDETTFDKLKVSGTGAGLKLTGASDTLNVSLVDKFRWGGVKTFRIFEGGPVTGTFETLLWNGATTNGEYTIDYSIPNCIEISVRAPSSGTAFTIR